jgi:hypothetical protein
LQKHGLVWRVAEALEYGTRSTPALMGGLDR